MSNRSLTPPLTDLDEYATITEWSLAWSELDRLGHANNARYFTWFEEARMAHFHKLGIPIDTSAGWGPILARADCEFLAPVAWPATLYIGSRIGRVGRSSFTMEYAALLGGSKPRCVALGTGVIVLVRYGDEAGAKVQIDAELRARLEADQSSRRSREVQSREQRS